MEVENVKQHVKATYKFITYTKMTKQNFIRVGKTGKTNAYAMIMRREHILRKYFGDVPKLKV